MMRRVVVNALALVAVLASTGIGLGEPPPTVQNGGVPSRQQPPPKKSDTSKLEEMLAQALKTNPDIRVAAANVTLAEAELNRTRLQVTQKVIALHASLLSQNAEVAYRQAQYERYKNLAEQKSIDSKLLQEAEQRLTLAKAKLAELEAQLPALLGKVARTSEQEEVSAIVIDKIMASSEIDQKRRRRRWLDLTGKLPRPDQFRTTGPLAERMRKALETQIKVDYKDVKLREVLTGLEKKAPGLSFHLRDLPRFSKGGRALNDNEEVKVTLHFDTPLPIAAILQAIEDEVGSSFIVRDYGILVTSGELPSGAVTVQQFMRQKP